MTPVARCPRFLGHALLIVLLALLAGCSSLKLAYPRLDWFVLYYVRGHVTLTDHQSDRLETALATFQRWHCTTELGDYARWLREVNGDIQGGNTGFDVVARRYAELLAFWDRVLGQGSAELAVLLPLLSDEQVEEYFHNLARDNSRYRTESVELSLTARHARSRERMRAQLERWIGELMPAQEQALTSWSQAASPTAAENYLAGRLVWQQALRQVLAGRQQPARLHAELYRLLAQPQTLWTPDYAHERTRRQEQTLRLIETIAAMLTPEQRRFFAQRALGMARDFDDLSCAEARRG
jgi:hypothetical protein